MKPIDHTPEHPGNDEFFFESDHLALRGNADYTAVLKTIALLHAQKIQAVKDVDKLADAEKEALENPEEFLAKLKSDKLDYPASISVAELPNINFSKYNVTFPELIDIQTKTKDGNPDDITVRGRVFDQTKPETFNQLWTCEEQRRLEELLLEYPPEPIEMRRFAKIARALGNRTTKQVASRVQKFFQKLHAVGMPVPGRIPKSNKLTIKGYKHMKQVLRPSTFFPAQDVPFKMPDDDDAVAAGLSLEHPFKSDPTCTQTSNSYESDQKIDFATVVVDRDEDDCTDEVSYEIKQLKLLQRIRNDKIKENGDRPESIHTNYVCAHCLQNPILGTMWLCKTCRDKNVAYCSDCLILQLISDNTHAVDHKFNAIRTICSNNTFSNNFSDDEDDRDDMTIKSES